MPDDPAFVMALHQPIRPPAELRRPPRSWSNWPVSISAGSLPDVELCEENTLDAEFDPEPDTLEAITLPPPKFPPRPSSHKRREAAILREKEAARAAGMTMYEASMLKMEGRVSAASLKRNSLKRVESAPTHGLRARGKGFCSVCACGPVR